MSRGSSEITALIALTHRKQVMPRIVTVVSIPLEPKTFLPEMNEYQNVVLVEMGFTPTCII